MTCIKSMIQIASRKRRRPLASATKHHAIEVERPALTILQDVPDDTELVKVPASSLASERLFELDHHGLHVILVQQAVRRERARLGEDEVGELFDLRQCVRLVNNPALRLWHRGTCRLDRSEMIHPVNLLLLPSGLGNVLHHLLARL